MVSTARLPGPQRREQLLDVARHVFAERGFHETSMNEVAAEAGVTKPVLYQHFASKRDLFRAVLEDVGLRLEDSIIKAAAEGGIPREKVERGIAAYLAFVEEDRPGFRLLFTVTSRNDDEWAAITRRVEHQIAQSVAELIDVPGMSTDRRLRLAHGIVGLTEGMVRHWTAESRNETDAADRLAELAQDLTSLAWGGLRGLDPAAGAVGD